jgi:DNA-binding transcriptional regulator YhcF (GntR family)
MLVRLDPNHGAPLYTQIAGQLRRSIAERRVVAGERLPAARELAEALEVNMHTVLRAYDELRGEGLIEMRRGRGVVVLESGQGRAKLIELARNFVTEGLRQGLTLRDLKKLVEESDAGAITT